MKRIISTALFIALLASLTACGGEGNPEQTTLAADNSTAESTTSTASILGFEKEDNGGKTFTIYTDSNRAYDFDVSEATGDIVSDAVYEKNNAVEEYLGIKLQYIMQPGFWATRDEFNAGFINDILSGGGEIDLISSVTVITVPTVSEGYFIEGRDLDVNFDNPWWLDNMYDRFSIANKLYGFLGDYSLSLYKDMTVLFFNKRIWDEFKAPNPYELVRNNEWTLDKFLEVCSGMNLDLNGDGAWRLEDDQLTYLNEFVPGGTWQTALELKIVEIGKNGIPNYLGLTERFATAYEKMATLFSRDDIFTVSSPDGLTYESVKGFANGNVATMTNFIYSTENLRDMKDDYGIIPIPKFDINQEKYVAQLGTSTLMLFVPKTTDDAVLTSKVMEALGYFAKEQVVPKYYDVALKDKYARDTDIRDMLDIIRDGATFDFMFYYGSSLDLSYVTYFRDPSISNELASSFASKEKAFIDSLDKLTEKIAALD